MDARNTYIRIIFLTINMFLCVLSWGQTPKGGQVTVTADPAIICAGEYSQLHASFFAPEPMTFDFENGMQGWTTIDADGYGDAWEHSNSNSHGGSYCMRAKYNYSHNHNDYLVSPQITLGSGKFSFYAKKYSSSYSDTFRVYLSTTGNTNANNFSVELTSGNVNPTTTYTKYEYDLSAFQGQGYVAIVYTASANQYYLYVDDITIYDDGSSSPNPNGSTYDFEYGQQGWTTIDADGHGDAWERYSSYAHSGSYCMSAKWNSSYAHQDYLVSPRITFGYGSFSFYARKGLSSYDDTFRVYISTTGNTNANNFSIELTSGNVNPTTTYTKYEYDLSAYQGQGYIAIVYTAPKDQYRLYVDDITIEQDPTPPGGGGSGDVTFHWEPGNHPDEPDITVNPTETTTYTVTALQNGNPIGSAQQTVAVYQDPQLSISTNTGSAEICVGDSLVLYVTVGGGTDVKVGDILCTDGSLKKPSEWPCDKTAKGIVFYVDATGLHGWAVDLGEIGQTMKWSTLNQEISGLQNQTSWMNAISDLDGYNNTEKIKNAGNASQYPAAWAAFNNGGYLPSAGQLNILFGEYFAVNSSLELVGGVQMTSQNNAYLWSSTANANNKVWIVTVDKGYFQAEQKSSSKSVRAVFDF